MSSWARRILSVPLMAVLAPAGFLTLAQQAGAAIPHSCTTLAAGTEIRGTLTLSAGETLCDSGALTNDGTIVMPAGPATIDVADFLNHGTVDVPTSGQTLTFAYAPKNLSGTTLSGGTWAAVGTIAMPGMVVTLAASVTLSGSGKVEDSSNSSNAFSTLSDITSAATFALNQSAYLQTGSVTSAGTIILGTKGDSGDAVNWQGSGPFTMTGGSFAFLDPNSCINVGSQPFTVTGGTLSGFGMLTGTVTVKDKAVFSPTLSGSQASFWLNGSYTQTGGTFVDDVADSSGSPGAGALSVGDGVSLGGTLVVDSSGERPSAGTNLTIVTGSSVAGDFSSVRNAGVAGWKATTVGSTTSIVAMSTAPPGAPRVGKASLTATGEASVTWSAPASDGGEPVTGYVVAAHPACACKGVTATAGSRDATVSGLTAGTAYTFTVSALNSVGTGVASSPSNAITPRATQGFWLAAADGTVFGAGDSVAAGGVAAPSADPVVGIAAPSGGGYYLVQRDGLVTARGGARFYGDLPALHVSASDVVAIAPTFDGRGYWLVGADGGEFAFGDARFHGSLPALGVSVTDVVGMVATPSGSGYLLVGADGGVFAFGAVFHGSLPQLGVRVEDVVGILPTGGESGYVLVGSDGGAFVFGRGSGYYGSLPAERISVSDVVGLALTPDSHGYWMVGSGGAIYAFGDAERIATPAGVGGHLPVAGIAG
jgi:hypothetical protein